MIKNKTPLVGNECVKPTTDLKQCKKKIGKNIKKLNKELKDIGEVNISLNHLKTIAIYVAIVQCIVITVYAMMLPLTRLEDDYGHLEPWDSADFWFLIISASFVIPLVTSLILLIKRNQPIMFTIQMIVSLVYVLWGFFHIIHMSVVLSKCNNLTVGIPNHPYCINRQYPADTKVEFSFIVLLCTLFLNLNMTIFWLWFGSNLKMALYLKTCQQGLRNKEVIEKEE